MNEIILRTVRTKKIETCTETDWVVIKEREEGGSVSNFADWKKYRQELRDITKTYKSLEDVKWSYCTFWSKQMPLSKIQLGNQVIPNLVVEIFCINGALCNN